VNPSLQPLFGEAASLLADGRWDEVEELGRSAAAQGRPACIVYTLIGVAFAKRGNMEMANRLLTEAAKPVQGPDGAEDALQGFRDLLGPAQSTALFSGKASTAIGTWPYMNELEVQAMRAALRILPGRMTALEWGGGHSTFFFAGSLPAGSVWNSIEHDAAWFSRLSREPRPDLGAKIELHLVPNSGPFRDGVDDGDLDSFPEYIRRPRAIGSSFRFILVDGRARIECLREGWNVLERDGIMVLHDAERPEYHVGYPKDGYRIEVSNPSLRERKSICFFIKSAETFRSLSRALRDDLPAFATLSPGVPGTR
jgi:hypothetical protein